MIRLAEGFYFLCVIHSAHPTIFVNEHGECVAMCDESSSYPHGCYDKRGKSLTDCFDDGGRSQLCDAYVYEITAEDYDVTEK